MFLWKHGEWVWVRGILIEMGWKMEEFGGKGVGFRLGRIMDELRQNTTILKRTTNKTS